MIPRRRLDIRFGDLAYGLASCLAVWDRDRQRVRVESLWGGSSQALACLSVRTGLDLLLAELAFPKGSEVLMSAVTIRDMALIVEEHGLVPVPVDVDPETLAITAESLNHAVTPRTRAVIAAHLFGSRMPLGPLAEAAHRHGLLVLEDCAQAFTGRDYLGHPLADVSLFSFGPIKTATALGGAVLRFREPGLCARVRLRYERLPAQRRTHFLKRVAKYCLLTLLSFRLPYSAFVWGCRLAGKNHDRVISESLRGFAGDDFFRSIRQQPAVPLLALLARRLEQFDWKTVDRRAERGETAIRLMPLVPRPGRRAEAATHWVFPILCDHPDELALALSAHGFDATRGGSSMTVIPPPPGNSSRRAFRAEETLAQILYLPVYPGVSDKELARLARLIDAATGASAQRIGPELQLSEPS